MASQDDRVSPIQEDTNLHNDERATMTVEDINKDKSHDKDTGRAQSQLKANRKLSEMEGKGLNILMKDQCQNISPEKSMDSEEKEQRLSPKKKRSRDQIEEAKERYDQRIETSESSEKIALSCHLASRSEPEKKRPRDMEPRQEPSSNEVVPISQAKKEQISIEKESVSHSALSDQTRKPAVTFANSGFASLASLKTSPFGSLGANKPSVFSGGISKKSGLEFSTVPSDLKTPEAVCSYGGGSNQNSFAAFGAVSEARSGINALTSESTFGSKTINAFTCHGGAKLSSFATPGTDNQFLTSKPAKAFGAPDSEDGNTNSDLEELDKNKLSDLAENEDSVHTGPDDKKKTKIVKIDDGEAGEVTLLQIRAKLFALTSTSVGWKERGVGTLKINVPESCVSYQENGLPISGSFKKSNIDNKKDITNPIVARLIMRQENTHRVVLNTIILPEMTFEEKPTVSSTQLVFTAFEGESELKPIKLLLKMSETNAKIFMEEIESIKHELEPSG